MEPKILIKPTEKQYTALQQAFDYYNEKTACHKSCLHSIVNATPLATTSHLFGRTTTASNNGVKLPSILITSSRMAKEPTKKSIPHSSMKCAICGRNMMALHLVAVTTTRTLRKRWNVWVLSPLPTERRTGQHVTHYIVEGGPFDMAFQEMPDELLIPCHTLFALKGESKKKIKKARAKTITYFCPKCGATVKGKEDTNVICGDCMEKMLVKTGRDR